MISLTDYTTPSEIRAVMGLSDEELTDDVIQQPVYERALEGALLDVDTGLVELYPTLDVLGTVPALSLQGAVQQYAVYFLAYRLCDVLPLLAVRSLGDSKAVYQRFDGLLKDVPAKLEARLGEARAALSRAQTEFYGGTNSAGARAPAPKWMGETRPRFDPVTGEGG